jgi:beta-lactamase regulating signal transducer with metallopeptidase domain
VHVVVNWLWQGVALTLVAEVAMRSAPRASASTRYLLWWVAMILVLLLPALPGLVLMSGASAVSPDVSAPISPVPLPDVPAWPLLAAVGCWMLWVLASLVRMLVSIVTLNRVRRATTPFPRAREVRLTHWQSIRSLGSRAAHLVVSDRVQSASVLGLGDAVIAVSPEAARRLTDEELDQVVLHEWAHVQRRDDYARLAQIAIRGIVGMHPAVWWIGRRLEIERETACDDYAVNITGRARNLAVCLTKLADLQPRRVAATLAPGVLLASQLTLRVRRLLDPRRNTSTRRSHGILGSAATALTIVAIVLSRVELVVAASPAPVPPLGVPVIPIAIPSLLFAADVRLSPEARRAQPVGDRVSAIRGQNVPAGRVPPAPRDDVGVAPSLSPASKVVDTAIATAPIDRLGHVAWQVPELPPLSSAVSLSGSAAPGGPHEDEEQRVTTPWGAAAEAGISIGQGSQKAASATAEAGTSVGRGSQKAAVATAGFFTKMSRKIAASF